MAVTWPSPTLPAGSVTVTSIACGHGASWVGSSNEPSEPTTTGEALGSETEAPASVRPWSVVPNGHGRLSGGASRLAEGATRSIDAEAWTGSERVPVASSAAAVTIQLSTGAPSGVRTVDRRS